MNMTKRIMLVHAHRFQKFPLLLTVPLPVVGMVRLLLLEGYTTLPELAGTLDVMYGMSR